jgi:hypothetical protein
LALAKEKLSEDEWKQINTKSLPSAVDSATRAAEDAKKKMEEKQWTYSDKNGNKVPVRDRVERILKGIEKYAQIVDTAIQCNPEIRSVYRLSSIILWGPDKLRNKCTRVGCCTGYSPGSFFIDNLPTVYIPIISN